MQQFRCKIRKTTYLCHCIDIVTKLLSLSYAVHQHQGDKTETRDNRTNVYSVIANMHVNIENFNMLKKNDNIPNIRGLESLIFHESVDCRL